MEVDVREAKMFDYDPINELCREGDLIHREVHPEVFAAAVEPPRPKKWLDDILNQLEEKLLVTVHEETVVGMVHGIMHEVRKSGLVERAYGEVETILVISQVQDLWEARASEFLFVPASVRQLRVKQVSKTTLDRRRLNSPPRDKSEDRPSRLRGR